jgi:hypothetical protein
MICPVCFGKYDKILILPVTLDCKHVVCSGCLNLYLKNNSQVKCPACLKITSDVEQLIRNNQPEKFFQMFESGNKSCNDQESFKVVVRTLNGNNFGISVRPEDNVAFIKENLGRKNRLRIRDQLILFNGIVLKDEQRLDQAGVEDGDILFLVSWIRIKKV